MILNKNITSKMHADSKKRRYALLFASGDFGVMWNKGI